MFVRFGLSSSIGCAFAQVGQNICIAMDPLDTLAVRFHFGGGEFLNDGKKTHYCGGNEAMLKRPLIREKLNVIQSTSPRRLMPHLLHQMVQNRTNLGGHSIQMIIIINQATT